MPPRDSATADGLPQHLERVAKHVFPRQVALLRHMVHCRTVSSILPTAEFATEAASCLDLVEAELHPLGFACERWQAGEGFPTLVARWAGASNVTIGFNGHIDVVPIEDPAKWKHQPWGAEPEGKHLYGRGACDAKAPVVAMIGALQLLGAAGLTPSVSVVLHIVSDEEVAGIWTDECLERGYPDAVIVGEPSLLDVWIAEPGLEHVRIVVDGLATHALNRWKALQAKGGRDGGVNAIEKALIIVGAIQALERESTASRRHPLLPAGYNTVNLGVIAGGTSSSPEEVNIAAGPGSVPDRCFLEYNIWYYPDERLEDIRGEIEARVGAVSATDPWLRDHPPRFTWALRGLTNQPATTDPHHPLVEALLPAARQVKADAKATGMLGASLLPWYTRRGIPGVIFGPGDISQAHSVDEFVDLGSLRSATLALALALANDRLMTIRPATSHNRE